MFSFSLITSFEFCFVDSTQLKTLLKLHISAIISSISYTLMTIETLYDKLMDEIVEEVMKKLMESLRGLLHRRSMESIAENTKKDLIGDLVEGRTSAMKLESMITPYQEDTRSEVNIPNRLNKMNATRIRLADLHRTLDDLMAMSMIISHRDRSEVNTPNRLNRMNTTAIKPSQHNYETYDHNILYTEQAFEWYKPFNLEKRKKAVRRVSFYECFITPQKYGTKKYVEIDDWDGKMTSQLQDKSTCWNPNMYVELDEPLNLEKRKEAVQRFIYCGTNYRRIVEPLDIPGDYVMQKHKDREYFITLHKNGTNKCVEIDDWDGKMTLQLQDKSTYCYPNMYVELDEPFNLEKRKKAVQRVSSFVIVTTAFLWIITDICGQLSPIQLQQEHGSLFIWSSLLEILSFMAFVCAILAMIVVGARFSHLQKIMLMFWAIWMQVKSAKSLTAVSPPILGILFTGWHVLVEKQPPHEE